MGRFVKTPVLAGITTDAFVGNDVLFEFTMSKKVFAATDIMVFIGGIHQYPGTAYTVDGTTLLTFSDPIPDLDNVMVMHGYNRTT